MLEVDRGRAVMSNMARNKRFRVESNVWNDWAKARKELIGWCK
jgi:hypothetical protein